MQFDISYAQWSRFSNFIDEKMGLYFPPPRWSDLQRGVAAAALEFGFEEVPACMEWLMSAPLTKEQSEILAGNLTVGETYFFRERKSFEILAEHILPALIRSRADDERRLRIWSAACCTGEEPYTTAVSETTTTVEEVRQTAQVASQKAKTVSETAQKAAQISPSGKKSTEESIEGMQRIRQQMEAIADSMVRLSEQTQAIGQIIATVEDLATQSNLLAVNASIEAAKAGEQGKDFAVVAQEVRSLAEQSKQATNQVRTILSDIQKATGAAVMATEQGSKAVEAGVKQSGQAGQSIQTLAGSVSEAAQAATQIAASSQQQLVGVDQVAAAMENIKQASTQNVASARQLETAAHNLNGLGQKLKQLVEQYKV